MKFMLATSNTGKIKECETILGGDPTIELVLQSDLGLNLDVDETGETFEENALLKAEAVMKASGMAAIADDSGLVVDALDGAPGVFSHRWGNKASDAERNVYLLEHMNGVPTEKRTAHFITVIAAVFPDGRQVTAEGRIDGYITDEAKGDHGFGYDSVFYVPQLKKTFAEANSEEKNFVSHRKRALEAFVQALHAM